jgi:hypothetical protein
LGPRSWSCSYVQPERLGERCGDLGDRTPAVAQFQDDGRGVVEAVQPRRFRLADLETRRDLGHVEARRPLADLETRRDLGHVEARRPLRPVLSHEQAA